MKKLLLISLFPLLFGCGLMPLHYEKHTAGMGVHTDFVLNRIYRAIYRRDSQRKGQVWVSSKLFKTLDDQEINKIVKILNDDGYRLNVSDHWNTWLQSRQEDISITW